MLIAVAVALAPLGAAVAASAGQQMSGMEDCDQAGKGGCPCCDAPAKCPPDLCLAKCFKLVGATVELGLTCRAPPQLAFAEPPLRPPNSREPPDPPPPRT
jgi:hypothetical protein